MDGWQTIVSFWDGATWQVRTVSFREVYATYRPKKNHLGPPPTGSFSRPIGPGTTMEEMKKNAITFHEILVV